MTPRRHALAFLVLLAFVAFDLSGRGIGCGRVPARVEGIIVDARTGAPVQGAHVLTLFDADIARDEQRLACQREFATEPEPDDPEPDAAPLIGAARTNEWGAFDLAIGVSYSETSGRLGITWSEEYGSVYEVAGALLVEKAGYRTLVHPTHDARWQQTGGEGRGTLHVGTIRLEPLSER